MNENQRELIGARAFWPIVELGGIAYRPHVHVHFMSATVKILSMGRMSLHHISTVAHKGQTSTQTLL